MPTKSSTPIAAVLASAVAQAYQRLGQKPPSGMAMAKTIGLDRNQWSRYQHGHLCPSIDKVEGWLVAWNTAHPDLTLMLEWREQTGFGIFLARRS